MGYPRLGQNCDSFRLFLKDKGILETKTGRIFAETHFQCFLVVGVS